MEHIAKPTVDSPVEGFDAHDMFFSRTDERGVIQSGNSVFVRLSGYKWDELCGAPHRVIRHPDMPKSVFQLLWQTISSGGVFCGYVKNRAATGEYYWVFAVVVPVEGGYLSVRIKPSTETFALVKDVYQNLKTQETELGFSPSEAETRIGALLKRLGYDEYETFMADALSREIQARTDLMTPKVSTDLKQLSLMGEKLLDLRKMVARVRDLFDTIRMVPVNLNVAGTRQNDDGRGIQVVAANYAKISSDLMKAIGQLSLQLEQLDRESCRGRVGFCSAVILRDVIAKVALENPVVEQSLHDQEMLLVSDAFRGFIDTTLENCALIKREASQFSDLNSEMRKQLSALSVTRVTCRIEAVSLGSESCGISDIANQLTDFQEELRSLLDRITLACAQISDAVPHLNAKEMGN